MTRVGFLEIETWAGDPNQHRENPGSASKKLKFSNYLASFLRGVKRFASPRQCGGLGNWAQAAGNHLEVDPAGQLGDELAIGDRDEGLPRQRGDGLEQEAA